MTPELTAIIAATVALAGLILNGNRALNQRMDRLEAGVGRMEDRLNQVEARFTGVEREQAHLAGLLEGLREAIGGSRVA